MEEYLKIKWLPKKLSDLEKIKIEFLSECSAAESHVYRNKEFLETPIDRKYEQPYVPGKNLFIYTKNAPQSYINDIDQAYCLTALKCYQAGKVKLSDHEKACNEIYRKVHSRILEENTRFIEFAKCNWQKRWKILQKIKPSVLMYMKNIWTEKLKRCATYPRFYKEISMLSLTYKEEDPEMDVIHLQNLLEAGTMAKCALPTLKSLLTLKLGTLPSDNDTALNSKLPVSEDENIKQLLETNDIDVVISSSSLKTLLDTAENVSWDVPVVVKNSQIKQVVFIDKPFPSNRPSHLKLNTKCMKTLVRTNFCKIAAFSYPTKEVPLSEITEPPPKKLRNSENAQGERATKKNRGKIHHNVSYRLWSFKQKSENELIKSSASNKTIKVLVRCKLDGCELAENQALQPVVLLPKVEYQLDLGGRVSTRSELSREWTTLFFRPYTKLYRVHIDCGPCRPVLIENCTMQKVNNEAMTHYAYKPCLGLGILYRLFEKFLNMNFGNYILHHAPKHGSFAALLKEHPSGGPSCFDVHKEYGKLEVSYRASGWHPIDVNLILPMHTAHSQMPGLFRGPPKKIAKSKKGSKGKKKKKAKRNEQDIL